MILLICLRYFGLAQIYGIEFISIIDYWHLQPLFFMCLVASHMRSMIPLQMQRIRNGIKEPSLIAIFNFKMQKTFLCYYIVFKQYNSFYF